MESKDLKIIKKHFGDKFAKLCKSLFPTILEKEGLLSKIVLDHFAPTRSLCNDIINDGDFEYEFSIFVSSFFKNDKEIFDAGDKTAEQLMDEAGYILYPECESKYEIDKFKNYYQPEEEICTFWDADLRLSFARVWFAVKKNVDQIKREDFTMPFRQDEYGTSVISIQFTKGPASTLSIKNRYNHIVKNPDATFSNNLENIIPGLTNAFVKEYYINLDPESKVDTDFTNYILAGDGKFYRHNIKNGGRIYCENNTIIFNNEPKMLDKSRYLVIDDHIIDKELKTIDNNVILFKSFKDRFESLDESWDSAGNVRTMKFMLKKGQVLNDDDIAMLKTFNPKEFEDENGNLIVQIEIKEKDSFAASIGAIEKIDEVINQDGDRVVLITPKHGNVVRLTLNAHNEIVGYENSNVEIIGDNFMCENKALKKIVIENVKKIGKDFLYNNKDMEEISLKNVVHICASFMYCNEILKKFTAPRLKFINKEFLYKNNGIIELLLPSVEEIDDDFMSNNKILKKFIAPKFSLVGDCFLASNNEMTELILESLEMTGKYFMCYNKCLKKLIAPKLKHVEDMFLKNNEKLEQLEIHKNCYINPEGLSARMTGILYELYNTENF